MPHKLTLQTLAENLIRESREPFSIDQYMEAIQKRWRRRIAPATLDHLKNPKVFVQGVLAWIISII